MDIRNKVVVITGAGSGIGRASAIGFAKKGASLAISDIDQERIDETAEHLQQFDVKVHSTLLDVKDWKAWQSYRKAVIDHYGHVDVVLNNAGVTLGPYTIEDVPIEKFEWVMDINFWGMVYGTKVFLPDLRSRPSACVANISSILGLGAISNQGPYCASKFGIRGFNESLRMEAMTDFPHVNVLSIHPGGIQTRIARDADWGDQDVTEEHKRRQADEFEKSFINTPDYAANQIISAIENDRKRLLIGKDAKEMWRWIRWFPVSYTKMFYKRLIKDIHID